MKTHYKKLTQPYFDYVRLGIKTFELRKNECDYKNGDILILQEYDETFEEIEYWDGKSSYLKVRKKSLGMNLTGRKITTQIRCVLSDYEGLQKGYVILGIEVLDKWKNL